MNSKKAKRLRLLLRVEGIDVTEREYVKRHVGNRLMQTGETTPEGLPAYGMFKMHTFQLDRECGRAMYKNLKRIAA